MFQRCRARTTLWTAVAAHVLALEPWLRLMTAKERSGVRILLVYVNCAYWSSGGCGGCQKGQVLFSSSMDGPVRAWDFIWCETSGPTAPTEPNPAAWRLIPLRKWLPIPLESNMGIPNINKRHTITGLWCASNCLWWLLMRSNNTAKRKNRRNSFKIAAWLGFGERCGGRRWRQWSTNERCRLCGRQPKVHSQAYSPITQTTLKRTFKLSTYLPWPSDVRGTHPGMRRLFWQLPEGSSHPRHGPTVSLDSNVKVLWKYCWIRWIEL